MAKKAKYNISKIIEQCLASLQSTSTLSGYQVSTLKLIQHCKTAQLGGHIERCVKYFHCVFTIPSELHPLIRYNKKLIYDAMMRCVKDTLLTFGYDHKHGISGKIGAILLLHTWTQQINFHPHVHCIVPAGGLRSNGVWKQAKSKGDFLFPAQAMANLFRGKLLAAIHNLFLNKQLNMTAKLKRQYWIRKNKLYNTNWVTYAKKAFGGPDQVLEYIGRYTHKICISNFRITQRLCKNKACRIFGI